MNTIKIFLVFTAVLFTSALKSQATINPAIQNMLESFIDYSNKQDWDKAFDLLYPKLFANVTKQELIDLTVGTESDDLSLQMKNIRITSTSVPVEEGSETFVRVEYEADMEVKIMASGDFDAPKAIQAMDQQFKTTYGQNNVKWEEGTKQYKIRANKAIMAISSGANVWKLVEINMEQPQLMESLFSPSIMDALVRLE
ncbi:MAG: hypothetical protein SH808_09585 [Saprospiraceae bacterium]|nr:hypothetical protein [Saprospiraceae bacterium]